MKYATLALLPLMIVTAQAQATEPGYFGGLGLSRSLSGTAEAELENSGVTFEEDLDTFAFKLFVGKRSERNNRFILSFSAVSFDLDASDATEKARGVNFDWHFVYGEQRIKPFWGLGFGLYSLQEPVVLTGTSLEGDNLNGISFQLVGGVKIALTEQAELDLSLQSQAFGWQDIEVTGLGGSETISMTYSNVSLNAGVEFSF